MDLRNAALKRIPVNQIILFALIIASLVGTVTFISGYLSFQKERYTLQEIISITKNENLEIRLELEGTRQKLELYNQALKEREDLQQELSELKSTISSTQDLLTQAKQDKDILGKEAKQFNQELKTLQGQVRLLEGKITGTDEIKLALKTRLESLKELRSRIKDFKRQAFLNKVKAQKEIDRVKLEKGNRGLVLKNGKSTLNTQRVIELETIVIKAGLAQEETEEKKE